MDEDDDQREAKRLRRGDADAGYPKGAIKKVRVHNFMTYSGTVPINPGPRLNLVLGPNGTGKSSLVCALCIGLGGSPSLLGRAENLKDYIQRGQSEAWTEITLSGGPGKADIVVRRDIKQTKREETSGYSSKWRLNGREATQADVHNLVKQLNIQFDNLCQFLPQDRVVEFARMDSFELLQATQKAIGDAHLYDQHKQLIAKRAEAKTLETSLKALETQLAKLEAENRALERDAERFRKRQKLQREIEDIRAKLDWLKVEGKKRQVEMDEQALELSKRLLARHQEEAADDAGPLKVSRQRFKTMKDKLQKLPPGPNLQSIQTSSKRLWEAIDKRDRDFTALIDRIEGLQRRSDDRLKAIADAERSLEAKRREFESLPPLVDNKAAMDALNAERADLQGQVASIEDEMRSLEDRMTHLGNQITAKKQRIAQLGSSKHRRLAAMDRRMPGIKGLHEWLEEQKSRGGFFKGPVFGPMGVEIMVRDAHSHAKPVEAAIGMMLFDFAATSRADEEKITDEMKRRGLAVRTIVFDQPLDTPYRQMAGPAQDYYRFGVECTMADLISAPDLVMQVLTSGSASLASSLLLADERHLDALMNQPRVRTVYTLTDEYRVIKASYDKDNGSQSRQLRPVQFLGGAGLVADDQARQRETAELQQAEQELQGLKEQWQQLDGRRGPLIQQAQEKNHQFQALMQEQNKSSVKRAGMVKTISAMEIQLKKKKEERDPLEEKPQLEQQRTKLVERHYQDFAKLMQLTKSQWEGVRERGVLQLAVREAEMQIAALESARNEHKEKEKELKERVAKVEKVLTRSRADLERARQEAELNAPLNGALQRRLDTLPADSNELLELKSALEAEVAGIVCNNPRALEEFQERQKAIQELSADVTQSRQQLDDINTEIEQIKSNWLPELQRVVASINTTFSAAFADIGCAGEVRLDDGGGEDYDKYSIQILVKFRDNEDLQPLTGTRQSGGERSVSTILYLIALQDVTVTPFRVVDEINQGMDPQNERKVFGQLVQASCRVGTPQCFLLTPKLLPDLEYTRDITVLQIMNGAIGDEEQGGVHRVWDMGTLLGPGAASLLAAWG